MENKQDAEDILIRRLLIGGATLTVLGLLATAGLIAVMVSYNFNILEWME